MKKFLHPGNGASKGAALISVLALLTAVVSPTSAKDSPTPSPSPTTSPSPVCLVIVSAQIVNAGNFYRVNDNLDPAFGTLCDPADNYGFRLRVASVDSGGRVTGVTIVPGIGYSAPPSNPIGFGGSATGTGFTANCTFQ